ncbi:SDR family NAD(P)-dependent oxidoreductase [Adhaeribacter sp. BT258]|uniref:SDR family NAD(P)-dependent oxidoreductase n=1 Tax=Adhaeribacter terrigena TaxID=2793070 RepID=A0ABS1BYF3_9BACT|nr:SDR family NAD(P)-dependent oxidoreductase [Adhaeribacter terrigena]MBK0402104.1 SDR family NAD(P)-dependent oxidoreductase [Adhaeribacter terrigena]
MPNPTVFITGATSGIGRATALLLGNAGFRIIAAGRRTERLEELKTLLPAGNVHTLEFDVRDKAAVKNAIETLPETWKNIDVLINNAGNAHGLSDIQNGNVDDWDLMIDINVKGLLYVSREIIPGMIANGGGRIINIGSIAGKEVYPNGNVYCASKFAVDALSKAMRLDLLKEGIMVSEINPGMVETEFSEVRFKGDKEKAAQTYKGMEPLRPEDIADVIHFTLTRPKHVNLADILILPAAQASTTLSIRK